MNALVSIITKDIEQHCAEFRANHQRYAEVNGLMYVCTDSLYWPDLPASFSKSWRILDTLRNGYEFVIWADADVAFTNMDFNLVDLIEPDYWLAGYKQMNNEWIGDRPYVCAGLMVIRNGIKTIRFFEELCRRVETREITWHPWEQWYVDEMLRESAFSGVRMCNGKEIGCFSQHGWNDGVVWKSGMPTVHISVKAWPERRRIFVERHLPLVVDSRASL